MQSLQTILIVVFLCCFSGAGVSGEIRISPGDTIKLGDVAVMCEDKSSGSTLVTLSDCQYWDKYDKRCLFEKKTISTGGLECVEECQHWDTYEKNCEYATKCIHYPDQNMFVRLTCDLFDPYEHVCKKTKELRIGGKSSGRKGQ